MQPGVFGSHEQRAPSVPGGVLNAPASQSSPSEVWITPSPHFPMLALEKPEELEPPELEEPPEVEEPEELDPRDVEEREELVVHVAKH